MNDGPGTLMTQEHRGGWLGMPRRYSILDFSGAMLGTYMGYMGVRELQRGRSWQGYTALALSGVMIWIHVQRFFYAPQDQTGFIRLARELGVTQTDLDRLRPMLPPSAPLLLPAPNGNRTIT